ncbi:hypothetical protein C8R42DRAFT_730137 [Lentinula raphanica]|nr:hypothetical protein C8R42DRAFT_730137 [Lentinula raphanica]
MITPIIFELRNAIRMVQTEFKIVDLSTKHTVPDMTREIAALADALKEEKIQSYVANRLTNGMKKLVRDLFEEGSKYPNKRDAFRIFREDTRIVENVGSADIMMSNSELETDEDYEVTLDDLAVDDIRKNILISRVPRDTPNS